MKRWIAALLAALLAAGLCGCEISTVVPPYLENRAAMQKGGERYNPVYDDPEKWRSSYDELFAQGEESRVVALLEERLGVVPTGEYILTDAEQEQRVMAATDPLFTYLYHYDYVNDNTGNLAMAAAVMTPELARAVEESGYYRDLFAAVETYHVQQFLDYVGTYDTRLLMDCGERDGSHAYYVRIEIGSDQCTFDGGFCALYPWKEASNAQTYNIHLLLVQEEGEEDYRVAGWIQESMNFSLDSTNYTVFTPEGVYEENHDNRDGRLWDRLRDMKLEERGMVLSNQQRYDFANLVDQVMLTWYVLHEEDDKQAQLEALLPNLTEERRAYLEETGALEALLEYTSRPGARQYLYNEATTTAHISLYCDRYSLDGVNYYWCYRWLQMEFSGEEDALAFYNAVGDLPCDYNLYVLLREEPDGTVRIDDWGLEMQVIYEDTSMIQ